MGQSRALVLESEAKPCIETLAWKHGKGKGSLHWCFPSPPEAVRDYLSPRVGKENLHS